jgi:hypothetical protein
MVRVFQRGSLVAVSILSASLTLQATEKFMQTLIAYLLVFLLASTTYAEEGKSNDSTEESMRFEIASSGGNCYDGCLWISAIGEIDSSTPQKFQEFLNKEPNVRKIVLHSSGGNLIAGLKLGKLFRQNKLHVSIGRTNRIDGWSSSEINVGICASACAYAFLGGVSRTIEEGSRIGFHQFYRSKLTEADSSPIQLQGYTLSTEQLMSGIIASYIVEMGVDARVMTIASVAGKNEMLSPNDSKLKALKVITSQDFNPIQLEILGNGIRAISTNDYVGNPVSAVSAACHGSNKQPYFVIETERLTSSEREIKRNINSVNFIDEDKKKEIPIPLEYVSVKNGHKTAIFIMLPEVVKMYALNSKKFYFAVDAPRSLFGTFIRGGFSTNTDEKKMLRLAWLNCV